MDSIAARETESQPRRQGDVLLLGQPQLRTIHAVGQSLAIGPIASVGVVAPLVAGQAGAVTPFVVVVTLVGALCLGWTAAQYARRYAGAGGIYEFIARTHVNTAGVLSAGLYFFGGLVASGVLPLLVGLLWQGFAQTQLGFDPGWWTGALAALLVVCVVVHRGIRLSVSTQLTLTALSAVPFVVLAIVLIAQAGPSGNTLAVFDPAQRSGGDLFLALLLALSLFGRRASQARSCRCSVRISRSAGTIPPPPASTLPEPLPWRVSWAGPASTLRCSRWRSTGSRW